MSFHKSAQGVWVFRAGEPLRAEIVSQAIEHIRQERDRDNIGAHPPKEQGEPVR